MPTYTEWEQDLAYLTVRGLISNKGGRTVIALHGYLDNANSMIGLASAFPTDTFIALDFVGHGKSDHRPIGSHYNQLDYVQDVYQLVLALNVDKIVLVGHSLGGVIASIFAALFPEKVIAMISIDALGPLTKEVNTTRRQIREAVESRANKMLLAQQKSANLALATKLRTQKTDLSPDWCEHILSRNIGIDEAGQQIWTSDSRLRTLSLLRLTQHQAQDILQGIQCPVLIIAASKSFKNLPESYQSRKHWLTDAKLKVLDGGHHIHLEKQAETLAIIQDFIDAL